MRKWKIKVEMEIILEDEDELFKDANHIAETIEETWKDTASDACLEVSMIKVSAKEEEK